MATLIGLKTDSDKLRNLDFLRFVASLGIVFYHSNEFYFAPEIRAGRMAEQGFGLYVDLFFMISGFVMAFVYSNRIDSIASFLDFLWRRVARLYPLHLLVLAINIAVWSLLLTRGASDTAPSFKPSCILQTALLVQEYFDCGSPYTFNGVTWSISVEMGMYLLFPLFLFVAAAGTLWIAGLSLVFLAVAIYQFPEAGQWGHLPDLLRGLVGFPVGIFLFRARGYLPDLRDRGVLVLVLAAVVWVEMLLATPSWLTMLTMFALFVVAVASDDHGNVSGLTNRLAPLGQLTYSMYIWHRVVVLVLMNVIADKLMPGNLPVLVAMTLLTYATVFGLSYVGYFRVELPARRALARVPNRLWTALDRTRR